jgi:nitroreductase
MMDYDGFLELAKARRSVRRFRPDPIPDEYVDKIIEAARWAPSGYNTQPWDFVVVKDKKIKENICKWVGKYGAAVREMDETREFGQAMGAFPWRDTKMDFHIAPVYIILYGDTRTKIGLPMLVRYYPNLRESIYNSSLANAFLYMLLAATTLGLATQWVSLISEPYVHCMVKNLLGIPKELEPYDMLVLGYPAYKPRPKLLRPKDKMVHYDYCGKEDFRTTEEVNDFARRTVTWTTANHRRGVDKDMMG